MYIPDNFIFLLFVGNVLPTCSIPSDSQFNYSMQCNFVIGFDSVTAIPSSNAKFETSHYFSFKLLTFHYCLILLFTYCYSHVFAYVYILYMYVYICMYDICIIIHHPSLVSSSSSLPNQVHF